jgi:phosphatidylglycerophosphate synthase
MGTNPDTPMRAVLRCGEAPRHVGWAQLLLDTRVGGLSLLQRHVVALREAGIHDISLAVPPAILPDFERVRHASLPMGITVRVVPDDAPGKAAADRSPVLEQRADTLVDPRLLVQLVQLADINPGDMVCLDSDEHANTPEAKSPYVAGIPEADEAKPVDGEAARHLAPIGLAVRTAHGEPPVGLDVGRYYWHRFSGPQDAADATTKVLLATMKATDGLFAQTNRRVSLRISRLLLDTRVTPNMVTMGTLVCGLVAGWLMSLGYQAALVAGALMAWFASMLDGVDGELARARFQTSALGHWLEMVCDYVFYMALFVGLGAGIYRVTGETQWLVMGGGAACGVVISFSVVAHLKRAYARQGAMDDFYLAYQRTVSGPGSNPFLRITPHLTALLTRAAFPYFLVAFTLLGLAKVALVLMFVATQSFWVVALYASRLRMTLQPAEPLAESVATVENR